MDTNIQKQTSSTLIYPNLSYRLLGLAFNVGSTLGHGHRENFYQRALSHELKENKIGFKEQVPAKIHYKGKFVGIYYFDFLIENKIVLELKVRNYFSKKDIEQLYAYLRSKNLKLGILLHFTKSGVKYKRVLNLI
jgi:GxxExxY protein